MNNALTFLGIAVGIAVVGGLVVLLMHRDPEASSGDGVDEFQRIMNALAPGTDPSGKDPSGTDPVVEGNTVVEGDAVVPPDVER